MNRSAATSLGSGTRAGSRSPAVKREVNINGKKKMSRKLPGAALAYLALYNGMSALLWGYFGVSIITALIAGEWEVEAPFATTIKSLCWIQSLAVLEVLHAAIGLVPSPVLTTTIQILSRLFITWLPAWTLSDFTRYIYYFLNLFRACPFVVTWARYTFFLVLYPMGTIGELSLILGAKNALAQTNPMASYALLFLLCGYPFGFAFMYGHMLKQRSRYLS